MLQFFQILKTTNACPQEHSEMFGDREKDRDLSI